MRKIFSLLVLLLAVCPAWANTNNIQRVQSVAAFGTAGGSTCSPTGLANTQPGDLIVVWAFWRAPSGTVVTVSDNSSPPSNTYATAVGPTTLPGSPGGSAQLFYAKNAGKTNTVTVNFSIHNATFASCVVAEYSGIDQVSPLDANSTSTGNSQKMDSGALAPSFTNELVIGAGSADNGTASAGAGFDPVQSSGASIVEDATLVSRTLYDATGSISTTTNWEMQAAAFRGPGFNYAYEPQPNDAICYVSPNTGNDANDGLSIGTAKFTIWGCLQALPEPSQSPPNTPNNGGTIYVTSAYIPHITAGPAVGNPLSAQIGANVGLQ